MRKVPHSWDDVLGLHQGVLSESFAEVIRSKFADLVDIRIVEFEKSEFERLLPQEVQNDVMEYRESVDSWKDRDEQVTQRFNAFAQDFFTAANEATLVRHVAYECGHISTVNVDFLAMHAEDPRAEEWEGHGANSFSILHPCGDGKTKYQALFYPLMAPGATDYRRHFFHAAQDDIGAALLSKVLEIFNGWRRTGALTLGGADSCIFPRTNSPRRGRL